MVVLYIRYHAFPAKNTLKLALIFLIAWEYRCTGIVKPKNVFRVALQSIPASYDGIINFLKFPQSDHTDAFIQA